MTHYSTKQIRKMDIDQKRRVYDLESKGLCTIEQAQIYSWESVEDHFAHMSEMFPTCTTADELLAKVMNHMNSFSAKMANPTNLQLAKDTLFLQLSK